MSRAHCAAAGQLIATANYCGAGGSACQRPLGADARCSVTGGSKGDLIERLTAFLEAPAASGKKSLAVRARPRRRFGSENLRCPRARARDRARCVAQEEKEEKKEKAAKKRERAAKSLENRKKKAAKKKAVKEKAASKKRKKKQQEEEEEDSDEEESEEEESEEEESEEEEVRALADPLPRPLPIPLHPPACRPHNVPRARATRPCPRQCPPRSQRRSRPRRNRRRSSSRRTMRTTMCPSVRSLRSLPAAADAATTSGRDVMRACPRGGEQGQRAAAAKARVGGRQADHASAEPTPAIVAPQVGHAQCAMRNAQRRN